ncbi:MAG: Tex-like N-terminal domain-containing protein, partial [Trichococcus flocculiformis]
MTETAQQIVMDLVKAELSQFRPAQIEKVLQLLEEGNTVPFIARYRKEATGSLDEVEIREIEERHQYATNLYKRKEEVIRIIEEQGKLTPKLKA